MSVRERLVLARGWRVGLLCFAALLGLQMPPALDAQAGTLPAAAAALAEAWSGDAASLKNLLGSMVLIELLGESHGAVDSRGAASALESFLGQHRTQDVEVVRVSEVGGDPARGFAEIRWRAAMPGTSEPLAYTVFAGFTRERDTWRVSEVRVLR